MPDYNVSRLFDGEKGAVILETYTTLKKELEEGLTLYFDAASEILKGTGIHLRERKQNGVSIDQNFFTAIFLYSYFKAGITSRNRIAYTAVNQCLRGMVTGCDNILDNEYKKTLDTDLPESSYKFRSIIDIMVSDRAVLAILDRVIGKALPREKLIEASFETLRALSLSGVEEASEEGGEIDMMPPERVLTDIHHYKTGLLFNSPWAVPNLLEDVDKEISALLINALYNIGIGCQVLDDITDIAVDLSMKRPNYIASLIFYGKNEDERGVLRRLIERDAIEGTENLAVRFPEAVRLAGEKADSLLKNGLDHLFGPDHRFMVAAAMKFLYQRIGVIDFFHENQLVQQELVYT